MKLKFKKNEPTYFRARPKNSDLNFACPNFPSRRAPGVRQNQIIVAFHAEKRKVGRDLVRTNFGSRMEGRMKIGMRQNFFPKFLGENFKISGDPNFFVGGL